MMFGSKEDCLRLAPGARSRTISNRDKGNSNIVFSSESGVQPVGTFWLLDLASPLPDSIVARVLVSFQRLDLEAVPQLAQAMGLDDPVEVSQRFASGRRCYAAFVDGRLVAYGWISFDKQEIGELGICLRLSPGEAYIWDCGTLPTYRGQHLYSALLSHMIRELHAEGLLRIWIGADTDNIASQRGMARAGFQPVADIVMVSGRPQLRGRSGVPEQLVMDVYRAVFGDAT